MRWIGLLLLSVGLTGVGCMPHTMRHDDEQKKQVVIKPPPAPPIVTVDSVNEKNAAERAHALQEEMDAEAAARSAPVQPK